MRKFMSKLVAVMMGNIGEVTEDAATTKMTSYKQHQARTSKLNIGIHMTNKSTFT